MDLTAFYNEYWSVKDDSADLDRLNMIVKRVPEGAYALEVDCGAGVMASLLLKKGVNLKATDFSPVACERSKARGIDATQVDLYTDDLPYPDDHFEYVISDSSLEHLYHTDRIVSECLRVLKPGGTFLLMLPNIAHWRHRMWLFKGRFPYLKNSVTDDLHLRFFTIPDARILIKKHGAEYKEVEGCPSMWVDGLYPYWFRYKFVQKIYMVLNNMRPHLFSRDFVLVCRKPGTLAK